MTIKDKVNILMSDGDTRLEAKKHLTAGTIIIESNDFEKNLESYLDELGLRDEDVKGIEDMIINDKPLPDWGVAYYNGLKYYILYFL